MNILKLFFSMLFGHFHENGAKYSIDNDRRVIHSKMHIMTKIYSVITMLESVHMCWDEPTRDDRAYLQLPWPFAALK